MTPEEVYNTYIKFLSQFEISFIESMMFTRPELTPNQQQLIDKIAAKYQALSQIDTIQLPSNKLTNTQNNILRTYKNSKKINSKQHLEFIQNAITIALMPLPQTQ